MSKSYKLKGDNYIDSTGIVHNKTKLSDILTYSTEEVRVGTWIDGKPLYRRVLIGTTATQSETNFNVLITNIDYYKILNCIINNERPASYYKRVNGTAITETLDFVLLSDKTLRYRAMTSDVANKPITIEVEYTKTTDTVS